MPVSELPDKGRVACHGYIESVTYVPADQTAAFTAIVTDTEGPAARLQDRRMAACASSGWAGAGFRASTPGPKSGLKAC